MERPGVALGLGRAVARRRRRARSSGDGRWSLGHIAARGADGAREERLLALGAGEIVTKAPAPRVEDAGLPQATQGLGQHRRVGAAAAHPAGEARQRRAPTRRTDAAARPRRSRAATTAAARGTAAARHRGRRRWRRQPRRGPRGRARRAARGRGGSTPGTARRPASARHPRGHAPLTPAAGARSSGRRPPPASRRRGDAVRRRPRRRDRGWPGAEARRAGTSPASPARGACSRRR